MGLCMYLPVLGSQQDEIKALFILAFLLFWKSRSAGYNHRLARKAWNIYIVFLCWTCFSLFVADNLHLIKDMAGLTVVDSSLSFTKRVLYFWGFTLPFALLLPILDSSHSREDCWQEIFRTEDHEL